MSPGTEADSRAASREGYARVGGALSWSILGKAARGGLLFLITVYVIKRLGEVEYGYLTIARTLVGFCTVLCWMGLTQALLRFLPEFRVRGNSRGARQLVLTTLAIQVVIWALLFAGSYLFRAPLEAFYKAPVGPLVSLAVGLMLVDLFVATASNILTSWYEVRDLAMAQTVGTVAYLVFGWIAVHRAMGPAGILWASAISSLGVGLFLAFDSRRFIELAHPRGERVEMRSVVLYSLPFALTSLLNLIIWNPSEVLILGRYLPMAEVSFYERAYSVPQQFLDFVPAAIWPLMFASFSEVYARDPAALPRAVKAYYRLLFLLAAPISVWGAMLAPRAIPAILGPSWTTAGQLCAVFFLVFAATYLSTPLSLCLYVLGKSWINLVVNIFNALLITALNLVLIPRYGMWGAVVPVGIVIAISPLFYYSLVRRFVPAVRIPWRFVLRCYVAALPLAALAIAFPGARSWYALLALTAGAVLLSLCCIRLFRVLGPEDRELVEKLRLPFKRFWIGLMFREGRA